MPPDGASEPVRAPGAPAPRPAARPPRPAIPADAAADVIRRAAELEQTRGVGESELLDEQVLLEIGREVGLEPALMREALDEYHAGLLDGAGAEQRTLVGPRHLVIDRTVPGSLAQVERAVHRLLEDKLLERCRQDGNRSVWRPRPGLVASLQRAGRKLSRLRLLEDVTQVGLALVELPSEGGRPPSVRVRLEVECRALRQGLMSAAVSGIVLGGGGSIAAAGAAIATGDPLPLLGVPVLGAAAAGGLLGARSSYARKLAEVDLVLQGGLDNLHHPRR